VRAPKKIKKLSKKSWRLTKGTVAKRWIAHRRLRDAELPLKLRLSSRVWASAKSTHASLLLRARWIARRGGVFAPQSIGEFHVTFDQKAAAKTVLKCLLAAYPRSFPGRASLLGCRRPFPARGGARSRSGKRGTTGRKGPLPEARQARRRIGDWLAAHAQKRPPTAPASG